MTNIECRTPNNEVNYFDIRRSIFIIRYSKTGEPMDPIISKMNREILKFIEHMDVDPNAERPTTFWFYSDSEENIYRLAHHLQEMSMKIEYCGKANGDAHKYLLIAEKWMRPTMETMNNLWTNFTEIAERFDVVYDGWETMVEP